MENIKSTAGRTIQAPEGYNAFVPNPLPSKFEWTDILINSLSRAEHSLGMLSQEGSKMPNPHLFTRPFIAREATLSSKIEGTHTTLSEILADEAGIKVHQDKNDLQEVRNYIIALNYGLDRLSALPVSLRLIKEIHQKLMDNARGSHCTPGEFRKTQNWIGIPGCTLATAKYVPPPPEEMKNSLSNLEKFLHDNTLPALIKIAISHYQFEAIHPFLDGNGRIGRLLITLLLIEKSLLSSPLLYLSAFFESTQDEYYKQLFNVSCNGNWNDWLIYFLNGVSTQSLDVLKRIEKINSLINEWQMKIDKSPRPGNISQTIIKHFATNPYLTIKGIAERLNIAFSTAQRAIEKLENLGIIEQTSEGKRNRVYCATEILNILEEPTKITQYLSN